MSQKRIANVKTFNMFCYQNDLSKELVQSLMANQPPCSRSHLWFFIKRSICSPNPFIRKMTRKYALNLIKEVSSQ